MVVKNDEKLLLPLLMETNKLLKLNKVREAFDLHSQVDSKGLFHTTTTTTTNTYIGYLLGFCSFLLMEKTTSVFYLDGVQKRTQVFYHCSLMWHILSIQANKIETNHIFSTTKILTTLHKCHLHIENLDKLIFVHKNWPLDP